MKIPFSKRLSTVLGLAAILSMAIITPAAAFDKREGDKIVIDADEVIEDDLYVFSETFTLDGTVKGDVVSFGSSIVINGTVEGDLIASGSEVIINGTVTDDVRIAGAVLYLGENGKVGDDLIAGGASLETKPGSTVGGDIVFGGGQGLLAGDVTGSIKAGTGGLDLRGRVGGDVEAYVDYDKESAGGPPISTFIQSGGQQYSVSIQNVDYGLTVSEEASIGGSLKYTSNVELPIPAGVVGEAITRLDLPVDPSVTVTPATPAEMAGEWALEMLRKMVTLILVGLLLAWLAPTLLKGAGEKIQSKPLPSLGWGAIAYAAFYFVLLVLLVAMILGAILFGLITLGGISTAIVFAGLLSMAVLCLAFVLTTAWAAPIIAGTLVGKWVFQLFKSDLAEHRIWPMLVGVVIITPFIVAPLVGGLFGFLVILFALGALWIMARDRLQKQPEAQIESI